MSDEYARYGRDAEVLAAIGAALRGQSPELVTLPADLADAAVMAWQRDEREPTGAETPEQRRLRTAAATVALIGLAVQSARESGRPLALDPETFAEAVTAVSD
jgi:hypothetical protein